MSKITCKYLGCIGVKQSMKQLDKLFRSEVAKESILRLSTGSTAQPDYQLLQDTPNLENTGTTVHLSVTGTHFIITSSETGEIILRHEMPNVSFAADGETEDHVAYVAKDDKLGRACFVFQCLDGNAKDVLKTIENGFERRKKLQHICSMKDKTENDNDFVDATRKSLGKESWYHGSYLNREQSEARLKKDGDFLVRESILSPGQFVLSIMHNGEKLHLLFDSIKQVKTKERDFLDISDLVKYHHEEEIPIVADDRVIYLRTGQRPPSNAINISTGQQLAS